MEGSDVMVIAIIVEPNWENGQIPKIRHLEDVINAGITSASAVPKHILIAKSSNS